MANQHTAQGGGFWNAPQVAYSKQTHDLLKEMMRESKLTNFQQRNLEKQMKEGKALPLRCPPTSSLKPVPPKKPPPPGKPLNPRVYTGGVRTRDTMEKMGAFEKPDYIPPRGYTRSAKEKERLANIMAYGQDAPPIPKKNLQQKAEAKEKKEMDRFKELQLEIEDRRNFLREMEALGVGDQYRLMIETEISQKIREMEVLDKKRNAQLQAMIAKKKREEEEEEQQRQLVESARAAAAALVSAAADGSEDANTGVFKIPQADV